MIITLKVLAVYVICGLIAGLIERLRWREGEFEYLHRWGIPFRLQVGSKENLSFRVRTYTFLSVLGLLLHIVEVLICIIIWVGSKAGKVIDYIFRLR